MLGFFANMAGAAPLCLQPIPDIPGVGFFHPINSREQAVMARTLESTPQLRAAYALSQSRKHRHHRDCRCRMYGGSFCSAADAMWQEKLNQALRDYQKLIQ